MNMKIRIFTVFVLTLLVINGYSQNNIITDNPGFENNTNGWYTTGNTELTHITQGAETPGAAKVTVISTNGNFNNAKFKSSEITIPQENKNRLNFLTFYVKTTGNISKTLKIFVRITNGYSGNYIQKSRSYSVVPGDFKEITFPVFFKPEDNALTLEIQIGEYTGDYIFDDFKLFYQEIDLSQCNQFGEWKPKELTIPENIEWKSLPEGECSNKVTIDKNTVIAPVLHEQLGVNSNFRSKNTILTRLNLYGEFGAFRFPAGSGSNQYFWDGNIPDTFLIDFNAYSGTSPNFLDINHFLQFKDSLNGEPTIVINYFYARYGYTPEGTRDARVKQAAEYAAAWVHYYNIEHNANIKYWEIGNECYGPWETGYDVNGSIVTGKEYGEDFCVFAEKMKAVDSTIKIGAVLGSDYYDWNAQVLEAAKNSIDFLIIHQYYNNISNVNEVNEDLSTTDNNLKAFQFFVSKYTGKPAGSIPVAFTEYNSQGYHTTTMQNGLFIADFLGNLIKDRVSLSTIWVNEWGINGNETHGIISRGDPDQPDYTARPSYTPYYYYGKCFGDKMIKATVSGNKNLKAYASTFSKGEIGLAIFNYSGLEQKIAIDYGFDNNETDTVYYYTVNADNINEGNKKFYVNGFTGNTPGGGPVNLDEVPAFAATINQNSYFIAPRHSVTYMIVAKKDSTSGLIENYSQQNFILFPNPATGKIQLKSDEPVNGNYKIFDESGKDITALTFTDKISSNDVIIYIEKLHPGIYFLQNNGQIIKFVKK